MKSSTFIGAGYRENQWEPDLELERAEERNSLEVALATLPERERQIVAARYVENATFEAIAQAFNLSKQRIWQMHNKAMSRLRRALWALWKSSATSSLRPTTRPPPTGRSFRMSVRAHVLC